MKYKIKHFSTSYLLWGEYHYIAYSSNKHIIQSIILSLIDNKLITTSRQFLHLGIRFSIVYALKNTHLYVRYHTTQIKMTYILLHSVSTIHWIHYHANKYQTQSLPNILYKGTSRIDHSMISIYSAVNLYHNKSWIIYW